MVSTDHFRQEFRSRLELTIAQGRKDLTIDCGEIYWTVPLLRDKRTLPRGSLKPWLPEVAAAEAFLSKCKKPLGSEAAGALFELRARPTVSRRHFGFKSLMHFSSYLMIVALVLIGLELAYAFYQLATFVL
jgi:hypothetical protein